MPFANHVTFGLPVSGLQARASSAGLKVATRTTHAQRHHHHHSLHYQHLLAQALHTSDRQNNQSDGDVSVT
jgi:hypothetical protein